jgi:hypothetical protein
LYTRRHAISGDLFWYLPCFVLSRHLEDYPDKFRVEIWEGQLSMNAPAIFFVVHGAKQHNDRDMPTS